MTTTAASCVCECEECLALRAAEDTPGSGETVGSFEHDGSTYEIDHLGIGYSQLQLIPGFRPVTRIGTALKVTEGLTPAPIAAGPRRVPSS